MLLILKHPRQIDHTSSSNDTRMTHYGDRHGKDGIIPLPLGSKRWYESANTFRWLSDAA